MWCVVAFPNDVFAGSSGLAELDFPDRSGSQRSAQLNDVES